MEAIVATDYPTLKGGSAKLLREPLLWASAATFVGVVVGLAGTLAGAASMMALPGPGGGILAALWLLGVPGYVLAVLSLLGVPALLGRSFRAPTIGTALLLAWLPVQLAVEIAPVLYPSLLDPEDPLFSVWNAASWATVLLGSAAVLSLGLEALFSGVRRLGAVLLVLGLPGQLLLFGVYSAVWGKTGFTSDLVAVALTALGGTPLGVPEACLFALIGTMLLDGARTRALSRQAEGNCKKALRLYEKGLGKGDLSVVDEVVSEDFRDLRSGPRGRLGMERIIGDLRASYPDLSVSVEGQEAEGDLVRTRLTISGTDTGNGVLWYPPTGRRVGFEAEFADRFRDGELVEHAGEADTEGLLRQLGHHREG